MTKTLISGLVAIVACTLMACGSTGGPSESDPNGESSVSTEEKSASPYYTCSGTRLPCSEDELKAIIASPTYDKKTGHFLSADGSQCSVGCSSWTNPGGANCGLSDT